MCWSLHAPQTVSMRVCVRVVRVWGCVRWVCKRCTRCACGCVLSEVCRGVDVVWVKIILNVCVEVCMWGCARMSVYFHCMQYTDASISEVVSTKHVWRRDRTKQQFVEKIPEQCSLLHWPITQYRHKFFISLMHDCGFGLIESCHMFTTLSEDCGEHVQFVHACTWQTLIRPKPQHAQSSDRDTWLLRV